MEQIYNDFTSKLLPKIQEGMVITKDYFSDLFGRYIKWLLVTDIIEAIIWPIIFTLSVVVAIKFRNKLKEEEYDWIDFDIRALLLIICSVLAPLFFIISIAESFDIVKDIYIPEVRIYEILKSNGTIK